MWFYSGPLTVYLVPWCERPWPI